MDDNQRASFRIEGDDQLQAEVVVAGRVLRCRIVDLSAGGARLTLDAATLEPGTACTLRVRLGGPGHAPDSTGADLSMEVLDTRATAGGVEHRLRNLTEPGSSQYEAAARLVQEAQRRRRAAQTGAAEASPMVSDEERRRRLRTEQQARYSRKALRPDLDD